jgi:hypothetical protein
MRRSGVLILALMCGLLGCGDPGVDITGADFEPRIIIQGYLYPQKPVAVLLTRNFPLGVDDINRFDLLIEDATATLTDAATGTPYGLEYNPSTLHYEYPGSDLQIDYDTTYRLEVAAVVEGEALFAHS